MTRDQQYDSLAAVGGGGDSGLRTLDTGHWSLTTAVKLSPATIGPAVAQPPNHTTPLPLPQGGSCSSQSHSQPLIVGRTLTLHYDICGHSISHHCHQCPPCCRRHRPVTKPHHVGGCRDGSLPEYRRVSNLGVEVSCGQKFVNNFQHSMSGLRCRS